MAGTAALKSGRLCAVGGGVAAYWGLLANGGGRQPGLDLGVGRRPHRCASQHAKRARHAEHACKGGMVVRSGPVPGSEAAGAHLVGVEDAGVAGAGKHH